LLRCPTCAQDKPVGAFALNASRRSGRQSQCRVCRRATDRARTARRDDAGRQVRRVRAAAVVARNQEWVVSYLVRTPCADCGATDLRELLRVLEDGPDSIG